MKNKFWDALALFAAIAWVVIAIVLMPVILDFADYILNYCVECTYE